jgi:thiol-disulfide isomerase/thioredoxin
MTDLTSKGIKMNHSIIKILSVMTAAFVLAAASNVQAAVGVGDIAPEISSTSTFNAPTRKVSISQFRGRIVLIDFWATWCGPCVASIPHLQMLHEKYAKQGLVVIGQTDKSSRSLSSFIKQKKMTYIISVGAQMAPAQYNVSGIPHVVLIGPKGKVLWRGHPSGLQERMIQQALTTVTAKSGAADFPKFDTPSSDRTVSLAQRTIAKGRIGSSLIRLRKIVEINKNQDQVTAAKSVLETVEKWYQGKLAEAEEAIKKGDAIGAYKIYNDLARAMAGAPEAAELNKKKSEARAMDAYKVGAEYFRLAAKLSRASPAVKSQSYAAFAKKNSDSYYGKLAAEEAQ